MQPIVSYLHASGRCHFIGILQLQNKSPNTVASYFMHVLGAAFCSICHTAIDTCLFAFAVCSQKFGCQWVPRSLPTLGKLSPCHRCVAYFLCHFAHLLCFKYQTSWTHDSISPSLTQAVVPAPVPRPRMSGGAVNFNANQSMVVGALHICTKEGGQRHRGLPGPGTGMRPANWCDTGCW